MALSWTEGCSDNSVVLNPVIPTNTYGAHETQGELGDHAGGHGNTLSNQSHREKIMQLK